MFVKTTTMRRLKTQTTAVKMKRIKWKWQHKQKQQTLLLLLQQLKLKQQQETEIHTLKILAQLKSENFKQLTVLEKAQREEQQQQEQQQQHIAVKFKTIKRKSKFQNINKEIT
ncbi:ecdysone-induced protein 74EF-like [Lucilia cuprina]|uniref:ecdysone-induced protein 74EF-like n=1 Tax=Lucilia cuprina TaxID=7375 RepID=UPI001F056CC8|nr:ecdysone-induced protein 74EF-like [Lucilia cuprina]